MGGRVWSCHVCMAVTGTIVAIHTISDCPYGQGSVVRAIIVHCQFHVIYTHLKMDCSKIHLVDQADLELVGL